MDRKHTPEETKAQKELPKKNKITKLARAKVLKESKVNDRKKQDTIKRQKHFAEKVAKLNKDKGPSEIPATVESYRGTASGRKFSQKITAKLEKDCEGLLEKLSRLAYVNGEDESDGLMKTGLKEKFSYGKLLK